MRGGNEGRTITWDFKADDGAPGFSERHRVGNEVAVSAGWHAVKHPIFRKGWFRDVPWEEFEFERTSLAHRA